MNKYNKVQQLADKFGIKVRSAKEIGKGLYRIRLTNGKQYALKPASNVSYVRWIDRTLIKIRRSGSTQIAWRRPHMKEEKKPYVKINNTLYVLNPWVQGRFPSPKSAKEMKACGIALAKFHQTAQKIRVPKSGRVNAIGTWKAELQSKHNILASRINLARKNGYNNAMDSFLQKHGIEILRYSRQANQMLASSNYRAVCARAKKTEPICHGDGGPTNFILNKKGLTLIDFETLRMDIRSYDLYRILYNSCKENNWKFNTARAILDGYQSVFKLNRDDYELMKVWLRFPRTTDILLHNYSLFSKKEKALLLREMPMALAAERKVTSFLHKLDQYRKSH